MINHRFVFYTLCMLCVCHFTSCGEANDDDLHSDGIRYIDIQGHRGARGMVPENTIEGFIYAITAGATTLEMDLVMSAERQMIISHEPWMDPAICVSKDGRPIEEGSEEEHNIFEMSYGEIMQYDCGRLGNERFPRQRQMPSFKPMFVEAIMEIQHFIEGNSLPFVRFNIELKSREEWDNIFHPGVEEYAELMMNEVMSLPIERRFNIQSFDHRVLQFLHHTYPEVPLALLVDEHEDIDEKLAHLGFVPDILSPHYNHVNRELVIRCRDENMQLIPWTVNDRFIMEGLLDIGVNAIITDYPNILAEIVDQHERYERIRLQGME